MVSLELPAALDIKIDTLGQARVNASDITFGLRNFLSMAMWMDLHWYNWEIRCGGSKVNRESRSFVSSF